INKTNVLTLFHDDWAKIVTSRVKTPPPPPGSHVIQLTRTIFEHNFHIKETNVLTKVHENWAKNVTSRVEKCRAHWRPYINKTNVLTNFHDDWAKIVTSRVFTRKTAPPTGGTTFELNQHIIKANILTNFELDRDIIGTNLLTNVYKPNKDDGRTEDGQRPVTKAHLSNQTDRQTDRLTDRQTDGQCENYIPPFL
ncbi:hypothetical protein DPMN_006424, partial [Dreissena polymorpha]